MHLNKLRDIKEIKDEVFRFSRIGAEDSEEVESDDETTAEKQKDLHAFNIDCECKDGRLALFYRSNHATKP